MEKKSKKTILLSAVTVAILLVFDQLTKYLAVWFLKGQKPFVIIPGVFEFRYLENQSAAFGIDPISILHKIFSFEIFNENPQLFLNVKMTFFVLLTLACVCLFAWIFLRIPNKKKFYFLDVIILFLTAGALGNFIDRVTNHYVVDFLYFRLIDFPIFNVADIYVTCAGVALVILGLFYYKDEDLEEIFPSKSSEAAESGSKEEK